MKNLIELLDLVNNERQITLNELIYLIELFPLEYIQIKAISKTGKIINNDFLILSKNLNNFSFKLDFVFPFIEMVIRKYIYETGIMENANFAELSPSGIGSLLEIDILKSIMKNVNSFIKCNHRIVWSFNGLKGNEKDIPQKFDIYNFKKLVIDDGNNPLDNCYTSYYITPINPNNEYLDSLFLIPNRFNNDNKMVYSLISTQITIRKGNIYNLEDYHEATNEAANLMEEIYNIKINNKYFIFILLKEYNNESTQKSLISKNIPFIFYSTNDKLFYFDEKRMIKGIEYLMIKEFKILDENDNIREEYLYYKNKKLLLLQDI